MMSGKILVQQISLSSLINLIIYNFSCQNLFLLSNQVRKIDRQIQTNKQRQQSNQLSLYQLRQINIQPNNFEEKRFNILQ
ncbi:transmembrane protein, putative (macronuclear) [Tetrahymena thermophila SB210]|uniref:Transmembrane protein, putative n=1 Tax=Tetrahymena thermophila (strain SB210) TaxID=312017 RepID=W7XHI2_TETTS|nr:transmembrane protein, putative [Tetrahymena thermophila SB210]EWS73826.1 transmembrane protein, putative [Tetrahymena thermophila SB210]|eukprot:XP_012653649.1 transmembrane protein, putative [Tetrahymena thermophila SB210]